MDLPQVSFYVLGMPYNGSQCSILYMSINGILLEVNSWSSQPKLVFQNQLVTAQPVWMALLSCQIYKKMQQKEMHEAGTKC